VLFNYKNLYLKKTICHSIKKSSKSSVVLHAFMNLTIIHNSHFSPTNLFIDTLDEIYLLKDFNKTYTHSALNYESCQNLTPLLNHFLIDFLYSNKNTKSTRIFLIILYFYLIIKFNN
jgi:hypothetical protein